METGWGSGSSGWGSGGGMGSMMMPSIPDLSSLTSGLMNTLMSIKGGGGMSSGWPSSGMSMMSSGWGSSGGNNMMSWGKFIGQKFLKLN